MNQKVSHLQESLATSNYFHFKRVLIIPINHSNTYLAKAVFHASNYQPSLVSDHQKENNLNLTIHLYDRVRACS